MPPDALQPKANPGLQSFLVAPPGVSTREPSSERRNYLDEKWRVISTESCDFHFHAYTFGFFYMPQICDVGKTALLPFRRKAYWGRLRSGLNPQTWVPNSSTLPLDHRSRFDLCISEQGRPWRDLKQMRQVTRKWMWIEQCTNTSAVFRWVVAYCKVKLRRKQWRICRWKKIWVCRQVDKLNSCGR